MHRRTSSSILRFNCVDGWMERWMGGEMDAWRVDGERKKCEPLFYSLRMGLCLKMELTGLLDLPDGE